MILRIVFHISSTFNIRLSTYSTYAVEPMSTMLKPVRFSYDKFFQY